MSDCLDVCLISSSGLSTPVNKHKICKLNNLDI